jgi:hypothetical protein
MLKLKSENKFFEFLRAQSKGQVLLILLCIGVGILMLAIGRGDTANTSKSTLEEETASLCSSIVGVGECRVMITYADDDRVYAVAVLCDGADSVSVRNEITALASSLFGIGTNRVTVLKLSK